MQYAFYSTRGVVECLIKHEAKPSALSDTRPLLECCKSHTALRARINYNLECHKRISSYFDLKETPLVVLQNFLSKDSLCHSIVLECMHALEQDEWITRVNWVTVLEEMLPVLRKEVSLLVL